MKPGDRVTLIGCPPNLRDDDDLKTKSLFEACVGKTFEVKGIETVTRSDGTTFGLCELHVGHIVGAQDFEHSIWVEPEYLEPDSTASS